MGGECTPGTVPMMRVSLDRVLRHATLAHFFAKSPNGPADLNATESRHKYAHAYQTVDNTGGESDLGIWSPDGDFTLSQQWYTAGCGSAGGLQTAECGNVVFDSKDAVLFLYYTNNGYACHSGCYNLDCTGFVQTNHKYYLGKGWTHYSSDGDRYYAKFSFFLSGGNWWFSLDGNFVGYYPTSVYSGICSGGMANLARDVDYGGEVAHYGTNNWPQMGSGMFASAGWSHAAAHSSIRYYDTDGKYYSDATLTTDAEDLSCFTIDEYEHDTNVGTWFTFGGGPSDGCNNKGVVMV